MLDTAMLDTDCKTRRFYITRLWLVDLPLAYEKNSECLKAGQFYFSQR